MSSVLVLEFFSLFFFCRFEVFVWDSGICKRVGYRKMVNYLL